MHAVIIDSKPATKLYIEGSHYTTHAANRDLWHPKVYTTDLPQHDVGETDILIKVEACGLCGSDVAMTSQDADGFVRYPFMMSSFIVPGHEFAGTVARFGKKVRSFWRDIDIGHPVVAQCVLNCGYCSACKTGEFDCCKNADELGFTRNGAMAEYCVVDMRHVWSIASLEKKCGDDIFLAGSLVEPHAGVFKAITASIFRPGDDVLVIGLGPIGLAAVNVYKALGAGVIFACDPSEPRQSIAETLGASVMFGPNVYFDHVIASSTKRGVSCIFEASGNAEKNWGAITKVLSTGPQKAELTFFGQSKDDLTINPQPFIQKYLKFSGSHGHTKVWGQVISLFAAGRIDPLPIITKKIALIDVPQWLINLRANKHDGKVTITNFERK